jgi:hypothetical protein
MDDYTVITHRPHRQTFVPIGLSDLTIEVSSVHHDIGPHRLNETCVFYPNGNSEVRGDYDDHDALVTALKRA